MLSGSTICLFTNIFEEVTGVKITNQQRISIYQRIRHHQFLEKEKNIHNYNNEDNKNDDKDIKDIKNNSLLIKKSFSPELLKLLSLKEDDTYTSIDILREICNYSSEHKLNEGVLVRMDENLKNVLNLEKDKEYLLNYEEISQLL